MRKFLIITLFFAFGSIAQAQESVGFTNVELIMSAMPEMQEVQKQLQAYEKELNKKLQVKQQYYQQKVEEYYEKKDAGTMTMEEEKGLVNSIAKLEVELQEAAQESDNKLLQKRMKMLTPIQTKLQKTIDEVAAEKGYTFIINQVIGEGLPTILYGKPELDITKDVMAKLGIAKALDDIDDGLEKSEEAEK